MNRLYIVTSSQKEYSDLIFKYGLTENGNSKWISKLDDIKGIDLPVLVLFGNELPIDAMDITNYAKSIHADIFKTVGRCDDALQFIVDSLMMLDQLYLAFHIEPKSRIDGVKHDLDNMGFNNGRGYMYDIKLFMYSSSNLAYTITPSSPKAQLLCKMITGYIRSVVLPSRRLKKPVLKGNSIVWE